MSFERLYRIVYSDATRTKVSRSLLKSEMSLGVGNGCSRVQFLIGQVFVTGPGTGGFVTSQVRIFYFTGASSLHYMIETEQGAKLIH